MKIYSPLAFFFFALALASARPATSALSVAQQAGGDPGAFVANGALLYQALGPSIVVSNNDADVPAPLFITPPLPGLVKGLVQVGSFLYAAARSEFPDGLLAVYSLADPAAPQLVRTLDYHNGPFSDPGALIASGGRLYLADGEVGILVVDLTDPDDPIVSVGAAGFFGIQEMAVTGGRLVGWGRGFIGGMNVNVFDLTQPAAPSLLGSFTAGMAFGGAANGNLFFGISFGLEIYDFSDLQNPQLVFSDSDANSRSVFVRGNTLYFGNDTGLHVWNVSNPAMATETAVVPAPLGRAGKIGLALVSAVPKIVLFTELSRGARFAVANPPTLEHVWNLPGAVDATAVVPRGNELFATDFYSGVRTLAPAGLAGLGRFDVPADQLGAVEGIRVVGNRAYVANWGFGLLILDLQNPNEPTLLGQAEIAFATAVEVVGNFAYVVTSTNGGFLVVVDVTNPALPQIVTSIPTSKSLDIRHHAGLLLVADESFGGPGGLRLFGLTQPQAPNLIGHYTTCDSAGGVDAAGTRAYLACHDGSLHVIDIANPANPQQLGTYDDPSILGAGADVALAGGAAFFAHGMVIDRVAIGQPALPVRTDRIDLGLSARDLERAAGERIWVAAGAGGIYQLEQDLFADGFESGDLSAWTSSFP